MGRCIFLQQNFWYKIFWYKVKYVLQIQGLEVIWVNIVQGFTSRRQYAGILPCWTFVRGGESQAEQSRTGQMCEQTCVAVGILRMSSGALPSALFTCFLDPEGPVLHMQVWCAPETGQMHWLLDHRCSQQPGPGAESNRTHLNLLPWRVNIQLHKPRLGNDVLLVLSGSTLTFGQ